MANSLCNHKRGTTTPNKCLLCGVELLPCQHPNGFMGKPRMCSICGARPEDISQNTSEQPADGRKYDGDKPRWDLLPFRSLDWVAAVATYGAAKYAVDNWQLVPDAERRYFAAALRHLSAWKQGERLDRESGLPHLAHAVCCLLYLLWFGDEEKKKDGAG